MTGPTDIAIQPITNTSPNGLGNGYRLEPEGTTFQIPITVTFPLDAVQANAINSTFVVTQHADGLWYSQPHQTRDVSAQTVSVSATHFSDWTVAQTLNLRPASTRVRTTEAATFTAWILAIDEKADELADPNGGDELAAPVPQELTDQIWLQPGAGRPGEPGSRIWAVNSIEGGNMTLGVITQPHGPYTDYLGTFVPANPGGDFHAPSSVPDPHNDTITLTLQLGKSKVIGAAEAIVYEQIKWVGSSDVKVADGTLVHADFTFTQDVPDTSGNVEKFVIESGTVRVTPAQVPGCITTTLRPDIAQMVPSDGHFTATYTLAGGPDDPDILGQGQTGWLATYTVVCPDGTQTYQYPVSAPWWPFDPNNPAVLHIEQYVIDADVSNAGSSGHIHMTQM